MSEAQQQTAPTENEQQPDGGVAEEELDFEKRLMAESAEMPRLKMSRRNAVILIFAALSTVGFLYFVLPQIAGLQETWERLDDGDPWWLAVAAVIKVLSFAGYIALFRSVCVHDVYDESPPSEVRERINWRASYEITLAGVAATRVLAPGGAGGIALTAWAMRRSGMGSRMVARRLIAFMVLLYGVYAIAVVVVGFLLWFHILPGKAPFGLTVIPALIAGGIIIFMLAMALVPTDFERRFARWSQTGEGRKRKIALRLMTLPALISIGLREAFAILKARDFALIGAFLWWGLDIATLWACFNAFGESPTFGVLVMAYFVGMLGTMLPLPGGVGGVEGGMIGAFIAFGEPSGLAIVAVLVYRCYSFWLPTIPGVIAYFQLRRTVSRWREA